jgi:hypothetical protein
MVLGSLAALLMPAAVSAKGHSYVPPGNSSANQYVEIIPTAGGGSPSHTITPGRGEGAISPSTQQALAQQGSDGLQAADLAKATAPRQPQTVTHTSSVPSGSSPAPASPGSSPAAQVVQAVTGASGQGGLGPLLPVILVAMLLAGVAVAVSRRRRRTT